ncbi:two-component system sensor histidine kinase CreC [Roseibacillus ishigakijimensis]|uniref:histidine kinase n=1 Tax=Roseibacillus ishigakijimensis TaxID=454146 RepID=A0A934RSQ6_9BACT|nr:two-component system sensor histidine kinase CreC [Roseibacillus ishigakijimensis]MBK1833811.1 two-component system sensor histidine kinase CreC [Roseibacillus ishigakijimensis]
MRLTRLTLVLIALILALGFYRLTHYLLEDLEAQTFQATEEAMVDTAHLVAAWVEDELATSADTSLAPAVRAALTGPFSRARERRFSAEIFSQTKTRVSLNCYVTDGQGTVLYDSTGERLGEDFSAFNDVLLSLRGAYGRRSSRVSESDASSSIMYVGAPIHHQQEIVGVVTVYKAQRELLPFIHKRRAQILRPAIVIALAILFLIGAVLIWLYRPIGRLAEYARRITAGERPPFPPLGKGREVNALGQALRDMREALEGRSYVENYTQTLTHELKSPLAAIRGSAELLHEDMPRAERERFLRTIRGEVQRAEHLINRLLHLAALEGRQELGPSETIVLQDLLRDLADELAPALAHKGVRMESKLAAEPLRVMGNRYLLRAAVENLLQNALQFSPPGGTITLAARRAGEQVRVLITDQGPGLPDFALARAFERFFSHRPDPKEGKGAGLGLTFVKEAAELHGGHATLQNGQDGGAEATLILPAD